MNNGVYNNKQIVSAEWVEKITSLRFVEGNNFRGMDYGFAKLKEGAPQMAEEHFRNTDELISTVKYAVLDGAMTMRPAGRIFRLDHVPTPIKTSFNAGNSKPRI